MIGYNILKYKSKKESLNIHFISVEQIFTLSSNTRNAKASAPLLWLECGLGLASRHPKHTVC